MITFLLTFLKSIFQFLPFEGFHEFLVKKNRHWNDRIKPTFLKMKWCLFSFFFVLIWTQYILCRYPIPAPDPQTIRSVQFSLFSSLNVSFYSIYILLVLFLSVFRHTPSTCMIIFTFKTCCNCLAQFLLSLYLQIHSLF